MMIRWKLADSIATTHRPQNMAFANLFPFSFFFRDIGLKIRHNSSPKPLISNAIFLYCHEDQTI